MGWVDNAIWWHVYPLGFCGAPIREPDESAHGPRLLRLVNWLDYAVELGASGLLLGPVFDSLTHGYDSLDQFHLDKRLGSDEDLAELIAQCHARGLRIIFDGVFSHASAQHPALLRALQQGPDSPEAALFDVDWQAPGGPQPRVFEGHADLVRFNHKTRETEDYVTEVMCHWLDRGIDGWRLDAAYSIEPAFWSRVLPRVREHNPQAWILGEVIHGDYPEFVAASGVDSVTQYELWKAIWSSIKEKNFFELDWSLKRHNEFLTHFIPNTFIGNHDVTRIASILGEEGAVTALAILLTVGGIPSIYSGDEQGFTGIKEDRLGGDDAVRPAFPDGPAQLAPWGWGTYRAHQDLIGLRRRHPWLTSATTQPLSLDNTAYTYRVTARDGERTPDYLDVHINLESHPHVIILDSSGTELWRQQ
ncbi:alpha-amylase family protein [Corynebacterium flavescens]